MPSCATIKAYRRDVPGRVGAGRVITDRVVVDPGQFVVGTGRVRRGPGQERAGPGLADVGAG